MAVGLIGDEPLYPWLLGDRYAVLPPLIRALHHGLAPVTAEGISTASHGASRLVHVLARLLRLPRAGSARRLRIMVARHRAAEVLTRHFDDETMTTRQTAAGPAGSGLLAERLGLVTAIVRLEASADALVWVPQGVRWLGIPMPRALWPRISAREFVADGWYRFDVRIALPIVGPLIHYEGRLNITSG